MEAYIDISYIFHLLLVLSSLKFMKIISNNILSRKKIAILEVSSLLLYVNVLIYPYNCIYFNIIYYIILFYLLFKDKFLSALVSFIFSYYSQLSIIRMFTNSVYIYKGILMISKPIGFMYILICPLILLIVEIITKSIKSLKFLKKYHYKVKIFIKDKVYDLNAYFDSGNTLKFKDLPVVFLTNNLKDKNVKYESILIEGIGKQNSEYLKGKILFDNKEKEVYYAYVNKKSFNGCQCLLNVYLLG